MLATQPQVLHPAMLGEMAAELQACKINLQALQPAVAAKSEKCLPSKVPSKVASALIDFAKTITFSYLSSVNCSFRLLPRLPDQHLRKLRHHRPEVNNSENACQLVHRSATHLWRLSLPQSAADKVLDVDRPRYERHEQRCEHFVEAKTLESHHRRP